ncbi:hypothetical protein DRQ12_08205 [candidate division KSB1 bacterium]|nr:MAG: hypothetical protein DRQ12_08205 [candidate division KSB1 bacterium]
MDACSAGAPQAPLTSVVSRIWEPDDMLRPLGIIAAIALLTFGISLCLGFVFPNGFAGNLFAEFAGVGLSTLVGVFVVDRLLSLQRQRQWERARKFILSSIASHLSDAMTDLFIYIPTIQNHKPMGPIIEGRSSPSKETIDALKDIVRQMVSKCSSGDPNKHLSDYAIEWYEHAKWDLDQIQNLLIPRAIDAQADQKLIEGLLAFDKAIHDFYSAIISHRLVVTDAAYPALITLVDAAAGLYSILLEYWLPSDKSLT